MNYTKEEVIEYVEQENVWFIRLAFCDVFGRLKNIAILPTELRRAFEYGIAIDASAIAGFGGDIRSDVFLHPDPNTLASLPWRSENGCVVRMLCTVTYPDGTELESDTRSILMKAVEEADKEGFAFTVGSEIEFYLFKTDEEGRATSIPYDTAGYMDVAPADKGENVRREICRTISQMGLVPETSHHEEGPGQNEIDFRYSNPLNAAGDAMTFKAVVGTIASRNGLYADFSPRPIADKPGSGYHITLAAKNEEGDDVIPYLIAGIMKRIKEITVFLNPSEESYKRLGSNKAPRYVSWSRQNRSQLIRVPATTSGNEFLELRSPDPSANPYLAVALLIYAGLEGIKNKLELPPCADINLYTASEDVTAGFEKLPETLQEAAELAKKSEFVKKYLPEAVINAYCDR